MATLLRPAVIPVCAMRGGGAEHGKPKPKQPQQWWRWPWGKRKQSTGRPPRLQRSGRGGGLEAVLGVLRRDADFLEVAAAAGPLRDIFWLRFLESKQPPQPHEMEPPTFPPSPYPPGLSCVELIMADLQALKLYLGYYSALLFTPMPQHYDPDLLGRYFTSRPHLLAFRTVQILVAFVSAAIKMRTSSTRAKLTADAVNKSKGSDTSQYMAGQLLKQAFLDLGPTFVKVGQSLSTRPDIIGSEISEALGELHENVPPFSREVAMEIIEEEFNCPVENVFSYISDEPVAAASFGQVYQGCTVDGTMVAIKVQRPDLLPSVLRDIYILRLALAFLRKVAKRRSNPSLYADELGRGFVGELDYNIEAANASKFLEAHSRYSFMLVPKVFKKFTRKRVLSMEWMIGENPNELLSLSKGFSEGATESSERQKLEAKARLLDLVNKGVESSLVQLLETGLLHADPHPGNLRYTPEGRIGFLDFGLLCMMEKKHQHAMLASIVHIVNGDWASLVYDLTEMDVVPPRTNLRRVTMDLEDALGEVAFEDGVPDIKFSRVLAKIWSVALKYHFRMPPYYTLVLRSLASLEGLAIAADRTFKTFQAAYPYVVRKLLYDNSLATRRVLCQVILNRRKEVQWQKIVLLLKLGSARGDLKYSAGFLHDRKGMNVTDLLEISNPSSLDHRVPERALHTANLCLRLLLSTDGVVIRRLIMTADGKSLARDMISKDAFLFRQLLTRVLTDVVFQWMVKVIGLTRVEQREHQLSMSRGKHEGGLELSRASTLQVFQAAVRDRRLKIISSKFLSDLRGEPILLLRVSGHLLVILAISAAIGLHRFIVYSTDRYLPSLPPPVPHRLAPT